MVRILIADEHAVVREGLRVHLEAQSNWEIVGEAVNGNDAVSRAIETKPDVAVLAYELPLRNGAEATRQIRTQLPTTAVLIYTTHSHESVSNLAREAGALGCVLKSEPIANLIRAVQCVAARRPYLIEGGSRGVTPQGSGSPLTNREREVVHLIADGQSNKLIARKLCISLKTVESHRASVMRKLELTSSAGLVRYAVRNGLAVA